MSTQLRLPRERHLVLALDTVRAGRVSASAWAVAGGLTMYGMAVAIAREMKDFPGGARALAESLAPGVEAMRVFRWPAERLDTLGGYLTYHNVVLINLLLAVYGAVQGVRAIRGGEERHSGEEVLATGVSRSGVVRDRALGFALTSLVIAAGLGLGTAFGLAAGGEPDLTGALVTAGVSGLVTFVGFSLGLAVSQFVPAARSAAGLASGLLVALYVVTNMGAELGPLAALRFLSPFHFANRSRAMVPGHGFDLVATAVLVVMAAGLLWLGAAAFERRDYAAAVWHRDRAVAPGTRPARVPAALLGSVWTAGVRRGWIGLVAWSAGAAALTGMFVVLESSVMDVWGSLADFVAMTGAGPGTAVEDAYWALAGEMLAPVLAAYVIVQASGWVADLAQGRVEMLLAGPVSWTRLMVGRWLAVVTGVLLVSTVALATVAVGGLAVDGALDTAGLGRLWVMYVLFGGALGAIAAVVVAWVRRPLAVTVLAVVVAASYLLTLFVALFDWPDWLNRLSVFWAFGHPYLGWPTASALVALLVAAVGGTALACVVAERTPKVG